MNEQAMPEPGGNPGSGMGSADSGGMVNPANGGETNQGQGQGHARHQQAAQPAPYPPQPTPQAAPYPYPPPYWPGYAYAAPQYAPAPGMGQMHGQQAAYPPPQQPPPSGLNQMVQEMTSGTPGLASLTKLLDFDDKDFWKGAMVGAAAVLLFTNGGVQRALFRGAVKTRDAAEESVEKVKEGVSKVKQRVRNAASEEPEHD